MGFGAGWLRGGTGDPAGAGPGPRASLPLALAVLALLLAALPVAAGARAAAAAAGAAPAVASAATAAAAPRAAALDPVAPGVPGHGRAYELVTPADPVSARVGVAAPFALSRNGDRVLYYTVGPLPDADFGAIVNVAMAERGAAGWGNETVPYPLPEWTSLIGGMAGEGPVAADPELTGLVAFNTLGSSRFDAGFFASEPGGGFRQLIEVDSAATLRASSDDLQWLVFSAYRHLLPAAEGTSESSLYELDGAQLRLLNVDDDGDLLSPCPTDLVATAPSTRRVFFTTRLACEASSPTEVFLRAGGETVEVSRSRCTRPDCGPPADARFLGMTPSGSVAYIATAEQLTNEDTDSTEDVYRYDVADDELTMLFPWETSLPAGAALRVVPSADGSRAYVLVNGQVVPGEGAFSSNLYRVDAGGLAFVAPFGADPLAVSADGRYAVFRSYDQLVAGDTDTSADLCRYDAADGSLRCLSLGVGGRGNGFFDVEAPSKSVPTEVGQAALFTTAEQLLPEDRNDRRDVYEWTPAGLGLVSAGTPGFAGEFAGASADGRTVLFATGATLLPRDRDGGEVDYYAARLGGGFPEAADVPACAGDSCAAPPAAAPPRRPPIGPAPTRSRRIELAPLDAAARRQLARGATVLLAEVPAAGRLTARATARLDGRRAIVAGGSAEAERPGPLRLRLRLTKAGRQGLARGARLRLRLTLSQPPRQARADFTIGGER